MSRFVFFAIYLLIYLSFIEATIVYGSCNEFNSPRFYGNSCGSLCFGLILSLFLSVSVSWHLMQKKENTKEQVGSWKRDIYMNCRTHRKGKIRDYSIRLASSLRITQRQVSTCPGGRPPSRQTSLSLDEKEDRTANYPPWSLGWNGSPHTGISLSVPPTTCQRWGL